MSFGGVFECKTKTPIGLQESILTFLPGEDGHSFTGTSESKTGTLAFRDGTVLGNRLSWKMDLTKPLKLTLECEGEFDGDELQAIIHAGAIGKMQLTGKRVRDPADPGAFSARS
mgnify:CR=1 FL=1